MESRVSRTICRLFYFENHEAIKVCKNKRLYLMARLYVDTSVRDLSNDEPGGGEYYRE